jgi:hypothetical protein
LWKEFREDINSFKPPEFTDDTDMDAVMAEFNQFMDSATARRDNKMDAFTSRLNEERFNRQQVQERLAFNIARISPAASLTLATAALAGTSLDMKNRFYDDATSYRKTYNDFMQEKTGMNVGGRMIMWKTMDEEEEPPEPIDPRELPAFAFEPPQLAASVGAALPDLALLTLFNLVFFAGAFVGFMRYDLR